MPPVKIDNVLPPDFDGIFRFTNWTDREFIAKWNNIAYKFAPNSTSPMIISGATPEEVQHIRRKFAEELGVQEFYRSKEFQARNAQAPAGSGVTPAIYTDSDIAPFVQRCLEPLPIKNATAAVLPRDNTANYKASEILKDGQSLTGQGSTVMSD